MGKDSKSSKRRLTIVTISFLLLIALNLTIASMTPVAKGAASMAVTPTQGIHSAIASIVVSGLPPNAKMIITVGSTTLGLFTSSPEGEIYTQFALLGKPPGTYNVHARDGESIYASATYTVIPETTPTPSESRAPTPTPTYSSFPVNPWGPSTSATPFFPISTTTPKPAQGVISPLTIGIILAAIVAVIIPVIFFIRRRGGPTSTYEETSETPTTPAPTYYPRTPTAPRYGQTPPYSQYTPRSTMASRLNTPSMNRQPSAVTTRVCPRCRQTVNAGYSICPNCNNRLR